MTYKVLPRAISEGASADVLVSADDPRSGLDTLRQLKHIVPRGEPVRQEQPRPLGIN
ncbi:hypothetical protein [Arthrobacter sp. UYEF20]|uniref:hypothetical protein n=1 Tax=Arthrobacter sp. UYEF20 TaxID=1756363 RepID=UPI00339736FF